MSVSNDSTVLKSTIDDGRALLSSKFLEFCGKVRNNDPSILPEFGEGKPFKIRPLSEGESIELSDALLKNTSVRYLKVGTEEYTKSSAEAMAKYVRTSKHLQRVCWNHDWTMNDQELRHREEILCCILLAIQESTSLKELDIELPCGRGPSYLAFENMLTHTQSLRSLTLRCPGGRLMEDIAVAAAVSGLKKNTTLRELTLDCMQGATIVSPILTSLRNHPLLRRLCLRGYMVDLTGLEAVLLSDDSKITELEIHAMHNEGLPLGLTQVLQALGRCPTLTKLGLHCCPILRDEVRLLNVILCNNPNLESLDLASNDLGSAGLVELTPVLCRNTSIKVLDISGNWLVNMESARLLRNILRHNRTMTALNLSRNYFGLTTGAVDCIAEGLGSNSTLLEIILSHCGLRDGGISTLARNLGSRNTTLQKLTLKYNSITSTGVGVLLDMMEHSCHITDLDLEHNDMIGSEGASLLARSLGNNALPKLTRISLIGCRIGDDGFMALVSALQQNTSLLHLDLRGNREFSERALLALAESLPEIKVLQRVSIDSDFDWCTGLVSPSVMPLLLAGLRKNTSLFRFHVAGCAPSSVPPLPEATARYAGGWMQEMELLGYRNRFLPLIRAPKETLSPRGIWPHALTRVATVPDVLFEVLRSKPSLVPC
jgi:Ran GTPase-activating protein (RanGAP) involved in mRNA processing and transport